MFFGYTVLPDSKETKLGSSNQEASLSAGKNTRVALVPGLAWKCVPTTNSGDVDYFWGLWVSFVIDRFSVRVAKITSRIGVSWTHILPSVFDQFLTSWIMAILSKGCKPDNFESHNSLKLKFYKYLWPSFESCWMWVFPWIKLLWHLGSMWDYLGWLNWFWQFFCEGKGFFLHGTYLLPFCMILTCFWLALLHSVTFSSINQLLCFKHDFWFYFVDEVVLINPSANIFVIGDFIIHHKDWLICSGGTDRPNELCYNFSVLNDLTHLVNFLTWLTDCDSYGPALLDLFISSNASLVPQLFPCHSDVCIMLLSQYPLTFC